MRKKLLYTGVVLLIIGIALVVSSLVITSTSVKDYNSFSRYNGTTNEWVSPELNLSVQSQIITTGNLIYVVNANYISQINQSNAQYIGLKSNINESLGGESVTTYTAAAGSYFVIYFNDSQHPYQYTVTKNLNTVIILGLLLIVGGVLFIAGIIISIVGAILKPKNPPANNLDSLLYGDNQSISENKEK
ncbi:MAG: hypothetical protein ACYDDC_01370 [Thermoplasmataceae archaeon]